MTQLDDIDQILEAVHDLPPAPQVLPQLLVALNQTETDLDHVVDLITFDPALTAKLLQTCNSAFFSSSEPVDDVFQAISRLGFQGVYRMVALVAGAQCLSPSRPTRLDVGKLWKHSVTVGFAAQFIAEETGGDGGLLFTAGILHDIGKVVLALAGKEVGENPGASEGDSRHAEFSGRLLERWRFSEFLIGAVRHHHEPGDAGDYASAAAHVCLADALAHSLESENPDLILAGERTQIALEILGVQSDALPGYLDRLKENIEFVEAMCRSRA